MRARVGGVAVVRGDPARPDARARRARKVDTRPHGKANSISHGARPVHQINSMIKWIRTSRLSMKNSMSSTRNRCEHASKAAQSYEEILRSQTSGHECRVESFTMELVSRPVFELGISVTSSIDEHSTRVPRPFFLPGVECATGASTPQRQRSRTRRSLRNLTPSLLVQYWT